MVGKVSRVAVIGAGTMGSDLSLLFALYNFDVIVNDISKAALDNLEAKKNNRRAPASGDNVKKLRRCSRKNHRHQ